MRMHLLSSIALVALVFCVSGCNKPAPPAGPMSPATTAGEAPAPPASVAPPVEVAAKPAPPAEPTKPAEPMPPTEPANPAEPAAPAAPTEPAAVTKLVEKVKLPDSSLTAGIPGDGPVTTDDINAWFAKPENHAVLEVELPLGLAAGQNQIKGLEANPLTRAKIELGRQLYFDPRLSTDQSVSCASCHDPSEGFAKHTQFGVGIGAKEGGRNSPVAYNRILSDLQFWDGRAASLEEQAKGPIANPIEMTSHEDATMAHEACVTCLKAVPGYQHEFEKVFGKLDIDTIAQAIASFERTLVTGPSPFDYGEELRKFDGVDLEDLKENDPEAYAEYEAAKAAAEAHPMSEEAKRGRDIYFTESRGNCSACHVGPNLTDEKYHNIGVGMAAEKPDAGRAEISKDPVDTGAFKTPTVRNVALSAPYMHDGSQATLEEVVEWYAKGGHPNPHLDAKMKKLDLSDQDKKDLVEFMKACTGEFPVVNGGRLPE